jgi:hypothetical protein
MNSVNYFKQVSTWSPGNVRRFLKEKNPAEYNLVDARTLKEPLSQADHPCRNSDSLFPGPRGGSRGSQEQGYLVDREG